MSKQGIRIKPGAELLPEDRFFRAETTRDIGCVNDVLWEKILGKNWTSKSDAENYEDYKKWYFKNCTKLGRYLYE
jgi:acyl carrier protein phosphodiesterase